MRDGKERMCAVSTLINAVVAEAPFTFITIVALPVTSVCEGFADIAEHADFSPMIRIVLTHENVRRY